MIWGSTESSSGISAGGFDSGVAGRAGGLSPHWPLDDSQKNEERENAAHTDIRGNCARRLYYRLSSFSRSSGLCEANPLIVFENCLNHLVGSVDDLDRLNILYGNHALVDQRGFEPVDKAAPERLVHQDDRYFLTLAGLDQGQRLEQLTSSVPKPPGMTT